MCSCALTTFASFPASFSSMLWRICSACVLRSAIWHPCCAFAPLRTADPQGVRLSFVCLHVFRSTLANNTQRPDHLDDSLYTLYRLTVNIRFTEPLGLTIVRSECAGRRCASAQRTRQTMLVHFSGDLVARCAKHSRATGGCISVLHVFFAVAFPRLRLMGFDMCNQRVQGHLVTVHSQQCSNIQAAHATTVRRAAPLAPRSLAGYRRPPRARSHCEQLATLQ